MQEAALSVHGHANCMQILKSGQRIQRRNRQSPQAIGLKIELNQAHSRSITMAKAQQQIQRGEVVLTAKVTLKIVTAVIII